MWWVILIVLYLISHVAGGGQIQYTVEEFDFAFLSPYTLYKYCKVNILFILLLNSDTS